VTDDFVGSICGCLFIIIAILVTTIVIVADQKDSLKVEAVERGYAEWVVDSSGNSEWKWKEANQ
jgi:hypothetical protein